MLSVSNKLDLAAACVPVYLPDDTNKGVFVGSLIFALRPTPVDEFLSTNWWLLPSVFALAIIAIAPLVLVARCLRMRQKERKRAEDMSGSRAGNTAINVLRELRGEQRLASSSGASSDVGIGADFGASTLNMGNAMEDLGLGRPKSLRALGALPPPTPRTTNAPKALKMRLRILKTMQKSNGGGEDKLTDTSVSLKGRLIASLVSLVVFSITMSYVVSDQNFDNQVIEVGACTMHVHNLQSKFMVSEFAFVPRQMLKLAMAAKLRTRYLRSFDNATTLGEARRFDRLLTGIYRSYEPHDMFTVTDLFTAFDTGRHGAFVGASRKDLMCRVATAKGRTCPLEIKAVDPLDFYEEVNLVDAFNGGHQRMSLPIEPLPNQTQANVMMWQRQDMAGLRAATPTPLSYGTIRPERFDPRAESWYVKAETAWVNGGAGGGGGLTPASLSMSMVPVPFYDAITVLPSGDLAVPMVQGFQYATTVNTSATHGGKDHRFGIFGVMVGLERMAQSLQESLNADAGVAFVVDSVGTLVASSKGRAVQRDYSIPAAPFVRVRAEDSDEQEIRLIFRSLKRRLGALNTRGAWYNTAGRNASSIPIDIEQLTTGANKTRSMFLVTITEAGEGLPWLLVTALKNGGTTGAFNSTFRVDSTVALLVALVVIVVAVVIALVGFERFIREIHDAEKEHAKAVSMSFRSFVELDPDR